MDEASTPRDREGDPQPDAAASRRPGWWGVFGTVAVAAFVAAVVFSTRSASLPVRASASPGMSLPGMSMRASGDRLSVTMRGLENRAVRLPGGRPGVVVFAEARGCEACVVATRAARDAGRRRTT